MVWLQHLDSGTTARQDLTAAILTGAPSLSNHDDSALGATSNRHGSKRTRSQCIRIWFMALHPCYRIHKTTTSLRYGGDSINVVYGNTDDSTSIELANRNPAGMTEVHLTLN